MEKNIRIISFLVLSFLCLGSTKELNAETASSLIQKVRLYSRDPSASGRTRFTDAQILDFLNEGQRDTIGETLCIRKEYSFDTSSGTVYYAMPSDFMQIDRLLHDNQRFEEKSPAKLDQASSEWETETGTPINFFVNFSSRTKVGFFPYPVTNTTTSTVKVEYYAQADDMTVSGSPFNAITEFTPFHSMLAYYAASQMLYIDGFIAQADRYFQRYILYRNSFNEYCRARPGYFPNVNVAPVR